MNYLKVYNEIIKKAKSENRKRNKENYFEKHHIFPSCYFKSRKISNYKENLVLLTAREHYICHKLLYKHEPNDKLFLGWHKMAFSSNNVQQREYLISSKEYDILSKEFSKMQSKRITGRRFITKDGKYKCVPTDQLEKYFSEGWIFGTIPSPLKGKSGKKQSKETRQKLREINLGKKQSKETISKRASKQIGRKHSKETLEKMSLTHMGKKMSEESKKKMSLAKMGNIPWNKGKKQK